MSGFSEILAPFAGLLDVPQCPCVFKVEEGHMKRFAQAIGDPNPLWQDEEIAANSRYGEIIAPPLFLIDMGVSKFADVLMSIPCPLSGFLNGGVEVEYFKPLRLGDTITTISKLIDLKERTGKSGQLLIMIAETTHTNQDGELVVKEKHTFIRR